MAEQSYSGMAEDGLQSFMSSNPLAPHTQSSDVNQPAPHTQSSDDVTPYPHRVPSTLDMAEGSMAGRSNFVVVESGDDFGSPVQESIQQEPSFSTPWSHFEYYSHIPPIWSHDSTFLPSCIMPFFSVCGVELKLESDEFEICDEMTHQEPASPSTSESLMASGSASENNQPELTASASTSESLMFDFNQPELTTSASASESLISMFDCKAAYPGVYFSKQKNTNNITPTGGIIYGEGITLSVPPGAVTSGNVNVSLQACLDGPFCPPEDLQFVSPVYLVEPHYSFRKMVTLSISMFIKAGKQEDIVFVTSPANNQGGSSWNFRTSGFPRFTEGSRIGDVELSHFCFGAFAKIFRG